MRNIKLTIMYDGTNYVGWQIQPNGVSVQSLLQGAVRRMTNENNIITGASRTDAGVHAVGQVANFFTEKNIPCEGFRMGLSSMLPDDIAVLDAVQVDEKFHSKRDSRSKIYLYRIFVSREKRPLLLNKVWLLDRMPDVGLMKKEAKCLIGENDFESFKASGCTSRNAIRTIKSIKIKETGRCKELVAGEGSLLDLTFEGNGFVRHMIRNIVGTLVDIGLGKMEKGSMKKILAARKRTEAGLSAPASGLYLLKVNY